MIRIPGALAVVEVPMIAANAGPRSKHKVAIVQQMTLKRFTMVAL